MMLSLRNDLLKFFTAFTLPLGLFVAVGYFNTTEFTAESLDPWNFFIQLFSAFVGQQDMDQF